MMIRLPALQEAGVSKGVIGRYAGFALLVLCVLLVDQASKMMVRRLLPYGGFWLPLPSWPWLRIVHWSNTGIAFGLFPEGGVLFAVLASLVLLVLLRRLPVLLTTGNWQTTVSVALIFGGALGNLADRLHLGQVVDFIAVGAFPVFNLADAAITLGAGLLFLDLWREEHLGGEDTAPHSETVPPGQEEQ
ncbi:signal peptidase II [Candidatus Parcubacteria bacterium]|nr:MAG: signal peptidase II [Candidatus Parcubacteria bacterium]